MSLLKTLFAGLVCSLLVYSAGGQGPAPAVAPTTTQTTPQTAAGAAGQTSVATGAATIPTGATRVHGIVTDPDGDLIPGATIMLTPSKGAGHSVKSGSDGTYSISLSPGTYSIVVSMPGFASYAVKSLNIPPVASTTLDFKLKIGQTNEVVNVEANAIQLSVDPDSNASATVLQGKDLEALSDDPDELSSELSALAGPSAGPNGGQIYVDGFTGGQLPPKSSIREIRINQNPFSAEYDKLGYGRVEVFTKPGTDKLHGNFQINGNPSQFNSSNPLTTTYQPPYHTMFMFGNLTGPLSKGASYNFGGTYRQIQDDEFTDATILAPSLGSATLCNPGDVTCVQSRYQISTYYPQRRVDINPRLDLSLGEKNVLTTRYQFVKNDSTNAGVGNLALPSVAHNLSRMSNELQMSDTQTFSPTLINETRFEYEREHTATTASSDAASINVQASSRHQPLRSPLVMSARHYIRQYGCLGIKTEQVADYVGVCRTVLEEHFRRELKQTVHQALLQHKLEIAREMLTSSPLPLAEIAVRCGFTSLQYMYTVFRREYDLTPKQFQAQHRATNAAGTP